MQKKVNKNQLDEFAIKSFVDEALDTDEDLVIEQKKLKDLNTLLDELNFINQNGELERDGVLFFGKRIPNEYSGATIRLSKNKKRKEVKGCLYNQVSQVFNLLNGDLNTTISEGKGAKRTEKSIYPQDALREMVMNAICHKDYNRQVPIQIKIDQYSIRVSNPGGLPSGWTIEKLRKKHESFPRNQKILRAFSICFYVEHEGWGIDKMVNDCKENGIFPPVFDITESSVTVTIYFDPESWLSEKGFTNDYYHKIMRHVLKSGSVSNKEVQGLTGLEERQSTKYLNDFIGKNDLIAILEKQGSKGRGVKYTLKKDLFDEA